MHPTGASLVSLLAALVLASVLLSLFAVALVLFVVAVVSCVFSLSCGLAALCWLLCITLTSPRLGFFFL